MPDPIVTMPANSFTWVFGVTMAFAFLDAYSIGANDVANSFATSVGSRSLTLWQAVCIAIFTEFGGALALGFETASTIKDSIISISFFNSRPDLLMIAFMCALIASSTWVMFATYMGWPVSTTHSIIGALIGVGVSAFGIQTVNWGWDNKGVLQIVASWFLSPILAGFLAAIIFLITRTFILNAKNSLRRGIFAIPIYFTLTTFIAMFYVVSKNGKSTLKIEPKNGFGSELKVKGDITLAFTIIGSVCGVVLLFSYGFLVPYFVRRLENEEKLHWYHIFIIHCVPEQPHDDNIDLWLKRTLTPHVLEEDHAEDVEVVVEKSQKNGVTTYSEVKAHPEREETSRPESIIDGGIGAVARRFVRKIKTLAYNSIFMDVATVQRGTAAHASHKVAVLYDNKTEFLYSFLQVMTAAFASFGHGSNDVANALGPAAGVFQIWQQGKVVSSAQIPTWLLAYCAFGIDCGLALYGYNIMRNLGNNITYHSPTRGFSMELGAALSVITASFLALPVSTTQCIMGATVAVGLCNGSTSAINWRMFAWSFFSWILTLPVAGIGAGVLFAILTRGASFTGSPPQ
ncbi:Na+/Pi symporter [Phlyctochytrium planicorne]|nr:Na+/Pi symporter [Phlyctochytrium planicorne]